MARSRVVLVVAMSVAIGGCASVRQTMSGWFGDTPPAVEPATGGAQAQGGERAQAYFAAVEGLTIYAKASRASQVVGHLQLHERVTRTRLENGFAYVATDKPGIAGWVDNAQLIWRLPAATAPATAASPVSADQEAAPATPAATAGSEADSTPTTGVPTAEPTPTATTAAPPRAAPEMFDPY